ncbi:MAG: SUMF1/EgtB/PvdO family nonheme iron enzyme, partial [Planctomycetota bacterium]
APETLEGAANLADLSAARAGADWEACEGATLDDGYFAAAPVNLFRANRFGLHNMAGNVWEWVQDSYVAYSEPARTGDGLRGGVKKTKVARGGGFTDSPRRARSAHRGRLDGSHRTTSIGVRPARGID